MAITLTLSRRSKTTISFAITITAVHTNRTTNLLRSPMGANSFVKVLSDCKAGQIYDQTCAIGTAYDYQVESVDNSNTSVVVVSLNNLSTLPTANSVLVLIDHAGSNANQSDVQFLASLVNLKVALTSIGITSEVYSLRVPGSTQKEQRLGEHCLILSHWPNAWNSSYFADQLGQLVPQIATSKLIVFDMVKKLPLTAAQLAQRLGDLDAYVCRKIA